MHAIMLLIIRGQSFFIEGGGDGGCRYTVCVCVQFLGTGEGGGEGDGGFTILRHLGGGGRGVMRSPVILHQMPPFSPYVPFFFQGKKT